MAESDPEKKKKKVTALSAQKSVNLLLWAKKLQTIWTN